MAGFEEAAVGLILAAAKQATEKGEELISHNSSAVYARTARLLDERSHSLFLLRARAKCLQSLLREMNGRDLSNSRLLMYTENDGKAWLLAQISEKIVRKRGDLKAVRNFFSVVGDLMLHNSTLWASDKLLAVGLWSQGGPLYKPGQLPGCEFSYMWGPELGGNTGHSYSDGVKATTSAFSLEYFKAATNSASHERLTRLVIEAAAMIADLKECRCGDVWKFSDSEWLSNASSKSAAHRVMDFVRRMRSDSHFRLPDTARRLVDYLVEGDTETKRARGVAAAYSLCEAFNGIVACSIGARLVGRRILKKLGELSSVQERGIAALNEVSLLNISATVDEIGKMTEVEARAAIQPRELYQVFGPGFVVGVSGVQRCVMDLSGQQSAKPAEAILELGGSVLPDLSQRYRDRDTLNFGQTIVSKRKSMTRVAFVRDPVSIRLAGHYDMVDVGGFEVSELSVLLGSLNLTYLTSEHGSIFKTWIYRNLWSRLCNCDYDAVSSTHLALFDYAEHCVSAWNRAGEEANGPLLSSAALYLATEVIGKKAGSYDGDFGRWCEALGMKRAMGNQLGIVADAPFHLQKCNVWKTGIGDIEDAEAVRLGGTLLTLSRDGGGRLGFCDVVQGDEVTLNELVPPTEASIKLR